MTRQISCCISARKDLKTMIFTDEELYFYFISLKTDFVSFEKYEKWLNKCFIEDDNKSEILLNLEFHSGNIEKTIDELYFYLFNKISTLNYSKVGKMIIDELKVQYESNHDSLREITPKLYKIWTILPFEIADEKPFISFNSIDDLWVWINDDPVMEIINYLFNYYNDK